MSQFLTLLTTLVIGSLFVVFLTPARKFKLVHRALIAAAIGSIAGHAYVIWREGMYALWLIGQVTMFLYVFAGALLVQLIIRWGNRLLSRTNDI